MAYVQRLGRWGERVVSDILLQRGYSIRDYHWQKREGEIDIIAYDPTDKNLVFIEVKTRMSGLYGRPEEAVDQRKKRCLNNTIARFISEYNYTGPYRCDIYCLWKNGHRLQVEWYRGVALE
jgi:putative endonuclease